MYLYILRVYNMVVVYKIFETNNLFKINTWKKANFIM